MALEDPNPAVRVEEILDGADIEPATRLEYFMKKAANEVPKPAGSSDAGKVLTVNEDGDGYELGAIPSGLPSYTSADKGKVLTLGDGTPVETEVAVFEEQTVEFSRGSGTPVSSVSFDMFAEGSTGTLEIDGVEYALSWFANGFMGDSTSPVVRWYSGDDVWGINSSRDAEITDGNHTISFIVTASVPSVEPKWEAIGLPDYSNAAEGAVLTIVNGVPTWSTT